MQLLEKNIQTLKRLQKWAQRTVMLMLTTLQFVKTKNIKKLRNNHFLFMSYLNDLINKAGADFLYI